MDRYDDLFDGALNLEEQYYKEGYDEGYRDGAEAGRIEGRSVGYKTGFEKFLEAGRLQGRAVVWANRIPALQPRGEPGGGGCSSSPAQGQGQGEGGTEAGEDDQQSTAAEPSTSPAAAAAGPCRLPPIASNARLERHVATLYGLVEPGTLSTRNDDESVSDFDSRMKGAQGKLRMIERALGEGADRGGSALAAADRKKMMKNENIEDIGPLRQRPDAAALEAGGSGGGNNSR